jgi:hypothetical protein
MWYTEMVWHWFWMRIEISLETERLFCKFCEEKFQSNNKR